jgi:hypothetical protein
MSLPSVSIAIAPRRLSPPWGLVLACLAAGAAWIVAEVGGGLAFLAAGVRLWRYEICPVAEAITSPVIWAFAATLIIPLSLVFDRVVTRRLHGAARLATRLAFLMTTGSVLEVLINEFFFRACLGQPLYEYLVLPTFAGSGSLLSPLYYSTLVIHVPITDRLLARSAAAPAIGGQCIGVAGRIGPARIK